MLSRSVRRKRSAQALRAASRAHASYFLCPLQFDADSQVRRYSPYSGMKEAIACVLTSFARSAPADTHLIIRNHPLDNGLIDYAGFIASFAAACGISDRVHFIEGGKAHQMMDKSLGVVVLNSTIGISALRQAKPVYCVGTSIYAKPGLAVKCRWTPSGAIRVDRKRLRLRISSVCSRLMPWSTGISIPGRASARPLTGFCKGWEGIRGNTCHARGEDS